MRNSKKSNKLILTIIAITCIVTIIVVVLNSGSETHISKKDKSSSINILDCTIVSPVEPFFHYDSELYSEHRVKAEFTNDFFDGFNYIYTGIYQSSEVAEEALSWLHADYNKYIAKTGVYQEDLYPTFSAMNSKAVINLFLPKKYLNTGTSTFVFLNNNEFNNLDNTSIQDMHRIYEEKGFTCNITNN